MAAAQQVGTPEEAAPPEREARTLVRIHHEHARDLRWYFGETLIAGIAIASNMGAMLERARLMAIRIVPCKRCGGDVASETPGTGNCPRKGSYRAAIREWHKQEAADAGAIWFETREQMDKVTALATGYLDDGSPLQKMICSEDQGRELPNKLTKYCVLCQGSGMCERRANNRGGPVTARPTGSSTTGDPDAMHAIDAEGLQRWGKLNRDLEEVCEESALARVALQMYYGPNGGSVACLWQLTDTGDRFLNSEPNPGKIPADQLMANFRDKQAQDPTPARAAILGKLARECAEVWEHACAVWVRLIGAEPQP